MWSLEGPAHMTMLDAAPVDADAQTAAAEVRNVVHRISTFKVCLLA